METTENGKVIVRNPHPTNYEKIRLLEIAVAIAGTYSDYKEIYKDIIKLLEDKDK